MTGGSQGQIVFGGPRHIYLLYMYTCIYTCNYNVPVYIDKEMSKKRRGKRSCQTKYMYQQVSTS